MKSTCDLKAFTNSSSDSGARAMNIFFPTVMRGTPSMSASADLGTVTFSDRLTDSVAVSIGGSVNATTFLNGGYTADSEL